MRKLIAGVFLAVAVSIVASAALEADVSIERIPYYNQPNCYKLSNGTVDVIVTTDVGPRVIAYRFAGGQNVLSEMPYTETVETDLGTWRPMGGHRLWHAPEAVPRSYSPDNEPVDVNVLGNDTVVLTQKMEPSTGIQKQIAVTLAPTGSKVTLKHTLANRGLWPVELAPWGLTVVRGGGTEIIPNEPYVSHNDKKLAARPMVLWHYTDLSDNRLTLGKKYVRVRTDSAKTEPNKIGVFNSHGWSACAWDDALFIKKYSALDGKTYPDMGCNFETYTSGTFMEMESLGPMVTLQPESDVTHTETWYLLKGIAIPGSDDDLEAALRPMLQQTGE